MKPFCGAVALVALLIAVAAPTGAQPAPVYLRSIVLPGQFNDLGDLAMSATGDIYVRDGDRVHKLDRSGTHLLSWGSQGNGDGQFNQAGGIGVDASGNVWVADGLNYRVQKFDANGVFLAKFGTFGTGAGQFNRPSDVAIDPSGAILVSESANRRIQKFAPDFTPIAIWKDGIGFNNGLGNIAIGPDGHVYVTQLEVRVFHLDPDGGRVADWAMNDTGGSNPYDILGGLAVDAANRVYVVDSTMGHIRMSEPTGSPIVTWGGSLGNSLCYGPPAGNLCYPLGIAIDGSDIFVANAYLHRIEVFGDAPTPTLPGSWGSIKARYR